MHGCRSGKTKTQVVIPKYSMVQKDGPDLKLLYLCNCELTMNLKTLGILSNNLFKLYDLVYLLHRYSNIMSSPFFYLFVHFI